MPLPWHLYIMAGLYGLAGLNHFRVPRLYSRMIPPLFPNPKLLNIISGAAEVILAVCLCVPVLTPYGAWGVIALLIAVFPANIYMAVNPKASLGMPAWILWLRLPLQIILIWWAYLYT